MTQTEFTPREHRVSPLLSAYTVGNALVTRGFVRDLPIAGPRRLAAGCYFFTASSYCNALAADGAALAGALPSEIYA